MKMGQLILNQTSKMCKNFVLQPLSRLQSMVQKMKMVLKESMSKMLLMLLPLMLPKSLGLIKKWDQLFQAQYID
jgi:hypothetical protein